LPVKVFHGQIGLSLEKVTETQAYETAAVMFGLSSQKIYLVVKRAIAVGKTSTGTMLMNSL
jgi:hypothetical protein